MHLTRINRLLIQIVTILAAVSFLMIWRAYASDTKKITIFDAIEITLRSNIPLKQNAVFVDQQRLSVDQARSGYFPEVSASMRSSAGYGGGIGASSRGSDVNGSVSLGLSSAWNLFRGFHDRSSVKQASLEHVASQMDFSRARQTAVFETVTQYIQAVVDRDLIRVNHEHLAAQRTQLELVEAFYKQGRRPVAEVYGQKAEVAKAELNWLNAKSNFEVCKLLLLDKLGLDPQTHIELVPLDIEALIAPLRLKNPESFFLDPPSRPDRVVQEKRVEAAITGIEKSKSGYWPSLSFSMDLGTDYSSAASDRYGFADQVFDDNLYGSVGLSLNIPIFDRFITSNDVEQAKLGLSNQELIKENLQQKIQVGLRQALESYQTAYKQVDVADSQKLFTVQSLAAFEERYKVNASTLVEVTQSRARVLEASYDEIKAKYNLVLMGIAVEYQKGNFEEMTSLLGR